MMNLSGSRMSLGRALKDEKACQQRQSLLGREFQWSMTREKKENFDRVQADRRFTEHERMATGDVKSLRSEVDYEG